MNPNNQPSQRQIRFGEVIRAIVSEALSKDYVLNEENGIEYAINSKYNVTNQLNDAALG